MRKLAILVAVSIVLVSVLPCLAFENQFIEDFTSTLHKDAVNTNAHWNTDAGRLSLFMNPESIGSCATPGNAFEVTVAGDLAFVADYSGGLQIIDISDPSSPTLLGGYSTFGMTVYGLAVAGDRAFLAGGLSGLRIIDFSDPAKLELLGTYDTPSSARSVVIAGDRAFVADLTSGLQVVNISDPGNPRFGGTCNTPGLAYDVAISGDYAFVADGDEGLQIIDISDTSHPSILRTCSTSGAAVCVTIVGDRAFVGNRDTGLQVFDISDLSRPRVLGSCALPGTKYDLTVSGKYAYVACGISGIQKVDISDHRNPTLLGGGDTPSRAFGVTVEGNHAFVADDASGLQVFEVGTPILPSPTDVYGTYPAESHGVAVDGDYVYLAMGEGDMPIETGIEVIDFSDPGNMTQIGRCNTPGEARDVAISGDCAFVADHGRGLQIVDITNPANPTLLGACETGGSYSSDARAVVVQGDYAFLADGGRGLSVIDITDTMNPTVIGVWADWGGCEDIEVSGDYAVAAGAASLLVFDITDPTNPTVIGTYDDPYFPNSVALSGDVVYLTDGAGIFWVVDISDPANPAHLGVCTQLDYLLRVAVSGNRAFVTDTESGLLTIDISDPSNPTVVGSNNIEGYSGHVAVSNDHILVTDGWYQLEALRIYRHEFISDGNRAQSLMVDGASETILRTRMQVERTGTITFEVSANGGGYWRQAYPGLWDRMVVPGMDLLWRATLAASDPVYESPVLTNLQIDWLVEAPVIDQITDVPDDDGGWVQVGFTRSGRDFLDETTLRVMEYETWRRVDDPAPVAEVTPAASLPARKSVGDSYVQPQSALAASTFPPGTWELVGSGPAGQQDSYSATVSAASGLGAAAATQSVFVAVARTVTPSIFYVSEPDSCNIVDSTAPGIPTSITAGYQASGVALDWDNAPETDIEFYHVYRDTDPGFVPSAGNLLAEVAVSAWTDATADPWVFHYKISALDFAGNEGEAGTPGSVSGVSDETVPARTALLDAVPNPFNPSTKLSFDLAAPGHARLKIYDIAGRLVTTLVNRHCESGRNNVIWDGRDKAGRISSAGVYLYRLEAGRYNETRRIVLIK